MNYQNKTVGITGYDGFIGTELMVALDAAGATVVALAGDVRDPDTFSVVDHTFDYLFHFGAPSSQVLFKRMPRYCNEVALLGMQNAMDACEGNGVKLIFPSTGLLSSDRTNDYATAKRNCELMAQNNNNLDSLAIRIFATYGPGEGHKRDYASVPYLFIRDALIGHEPIVFGDGEQKRDFIYIDDVRDAILILAEECSDPIIDLGSGESHSFNHILRTIQDLEGEFRVRRVSKPEGYVEETAADVTRLHEFYVPKISFKEGIERTVRHESNSYNNDK